MRTNEPPKRYDSPEKESVPAEHLVFVTPGMKVRSAALWTRTTPDYPFAVSGDALTRARRRRQDLEQNQRAERIAQRKLAPAQERGAL